MLPYKVWEGFCSTIFLYFVAILLRLATAVISFGHDENLAKCSEPLPSFLDTVPLSALSLSSLSPSGLMRLKKSWPWHWSGNFASSLLSGCLISWIEMCSKKVPLASEGGCPDFINPVGHINMKSSTFVVDVAQIYTTVFINKVTCFCRYIKVVCHKSSYFQSKYCCTPFCRMFQFFFKTAFFTISTADLASDKNKSASST